MWKEKRNEQTNERTNDRKETLVQISRCPSDPSAHLRPGNSEEERELIITYSRCVALPISQIFINILHFLSCLHIRGSPVPATTTTESIDGYGSDVKFYDAGGGTP